MSDIHDADDSLDGLNSHDGDSLGVDNSAILEQSPTDTSQSENVDSLVEDPELEAIKARVKEMEAEAEKLKEMQNEMEKQINLSPPPPHLAAGAVAFPSMEEKAEADTRSVYVGNVDYSATAEELEQHFHGCGAVNRITILCDKFTGHPKGFGYIEFSDQESVETSLALDGSLFRGRQIKVNAKRTNKPHFHFTDRPRPRGRPRYRARGYHGFPRSRRVFRGRARAMYYSPY